MGCTSSAPNMANSSTAEKSIQFEEELSDEQLKDTEEIIYRSENHQTYDSTVLPSCDTLSENLNVVRNKSKSSLKAEKDDYENNPFREDTDFNDTPKEEEKVPKLEEVVERVVELHNSEITNNVALVFKKEESQIQESSSENKIESQFIKENDKHEEVIQDTEIIDHPEEATSPSQSESSRATRWEALADIAAELPPSLTVDPITGQIYAVSK